MSTRKVVYTQARAQSLPGGGATVTLDGRPLRTPGKSAFVVPSDSLASAIASEWQAQTDEIRPDTMPLTRFANSAIDKIPAQFEETAAALAAYGETDMTCFRASSPDSLVARQTAAWTPPLDWLRKTHGIHLVATEGVVAIDQPPEALAALHDWLRAQSPFALMGLHELIGLSGSIVLARALAEDAMTAENCWQASIIEEMWNVETWGEDDEAARLRETKRQDFLAAHRFYLLQREAP